MSWCLLQDRWRGWEHLGVLLSLVYCLVMCLLGLLALLVRSDSSKDAELLVLRHENQVLRVSSTGAACGGTAQGLRSPQWGLVS